MPAAVHFAPNPSHLPIAEESHLRAYLQNSLPADLKMKVVLKWGGQLLTLSTGSWHGTQWINQVFVYDASPHSYRPGGLSDAALLHVTGDDPDLADIDEAKKLSLLSGLPVAIVFNEPNQPLFGRSEDDLLAYSYVKQVETGDWSWPVLFPMVRSVIGAMNGIENVTKGHLHRFIVFGNSKRGGTTWLTAESGDKRVIGIAPGSIDILNISRQLQEQQAEWGHPSPMYQPYQAAGLLGSAQTPAVQNLLAGIDPYTNLGQINVPILSIRGASDPFWLPNAVQFFKDRLPERTWLLNLPNEPHDYKNREPYLADLAAFSRMAAARDGWPHIHTRMIRGKLKVWCSQSPNSIKLFTSHGSKAVFPVGSWALSGVSAPPSGSQVGWLKMPQLNAMKGAWFVSATFTQHVGFRTQEFTISSPIQLVNLFHPVEDSKSQVE